MYPTLFEVSGAAPSDISSSLLMTAQLILQSEKGKRMEARPLLDTGFSASLVTKKVAA